MMNEYDLVKINKLAKVARELCKKHSCHDVDRFLKEIEQLSEEQHDT